MEIERGGEILGKVKKVGLKISFICPSWNLCFRMVGKMCKYINMEKVIHAKGDVEGVEGQYEVTRQ